MSTDENYELLIEALRFTSGIIVGLTDKLVIHEKRIEELENQVLMLVACRENMEFEGCANISNGTQLDSDSDRISSYLEKHDKKKKVKKTHDAKLEHAIKQTNPNIQFNSNVGKLDSIVRDKNKMNKLIDTIIEKKNADLEPTIKIDSKNSQLVGVGVGVGCTSNDSNEMLKYTRKKMNFTKRF